MRSRLSTSSKRLPGDCRQCQRRCDAAWDRRRCDGISNSSDPYLDAAWRAQNATTTGATTTQAYLQQIQSALNEPSKTGIESQLSTFWSDWNTLADNPTSAAAQQSVVDDGEDLSQSFNTLSNTLNGPTRTIRAIRPTALRSSGRSTPSTRTSWKAHRGWCLWRQHLQRRLPDLLAQLPDHSGPGGRPDRQRSDRSAQRGTGQPFVAR